MKHITLLSLLFVCLALRGQAGSLPMAHAEAGPPAAAISIAVHPARVPMGKTVMVTATETGVLPVAGRELWAYVNGTQWGAQGITDAQGRTTFLLPLPNVGPARIQVATVSPSFHWNDNVFGQTSDFIVGTPLPPDVSVSAPVTVQVTPRKITPLIDPNHLVGTPWYPWFTSYNAHVNGGHSGAEAVSLLGSYASAEPDVIRQQMLWMDEIGVNFIQVDWSNNLTDAQHWQDRLPGVKQMVGSTTVLLDTLAAMRHEGLPTPQVVLLLGMAPPFSIAALNEEMQWVHDNFTTNPKYAGLFVNYLGKPLATVLSVLYGPQLAHQGAVDTSEFTVRWEWVSVADRPGWWSWTDGYLPPTTAYFNGQAESLSVTPAFSTGTGWLDPKSLGKRGGATWVQGFQEAVRRQPRFLFLQQWNEWGEQYNTELSDDIEPSALASLGMGRTKVPGGAGPGWGFFYLNLARALIAVYHAHAPESTILTVASPLRGAGITDPSMTVSWEVLGKPARSYSVALDGKTVASDIHGNSYVLSLSGAAVGPHVVTVRAEGAVTRFLLPFDADADPLKTPIPCAVSVPFSVPPAIPLTVMR